MHERCTTNLPVVTTYNQSESRDHGEQRLALGSDPISTLSILKSEHLYATSRDRDSVIELGIKVVRIGTLIIIRVMDMVW